MATIGSADFGGRERRPRQDELSSTARQGLGVDPPDDEEIPSDTPARRPSATREHPTTRQMRVARQTERVDPTIAIARGGRRRVSGKESIMFTSTSAHRASRERRALGASSRSSEGGEGLQGLGCARGGEVAVSHEGASHPRRLER